MEQRFIDLYSERKTDTIDPAALRSTQEGTRRRVEAAMMVALLGALQTDNLKSILDVGCGFGDLGEFLHTEGFSDLEYSGIDMLDWVVQAANKDRPHLHIENKELSAPGVPVVDVAFALGVLATIPPERMHGFFELMGSHSKSGFVVSYLHKDEYVTDEGFYSYSLFDIYEATPDGMKVTVLHTPKGGITTLCYIDVTG